MDNSAFKIKVSNFKHNRRVQKRLMVLGCRFMSGYRTRIRGINKGYVCVTTKNTMFVDNYGRGVMYKEIPYLHLYIGNFLKDRFPEFYESQKRRPI